MEDFGLFKGSKSLDYGATWETENCISEAKMEKYFNSEGLRYKMNKTEKEASEYPPLFGIGPRVESIWEALGFTATSNNEARQQEKLKAIEKYGYPRLDGTGGIFYADQLSTDKVPMGGFNMGKGGVMWPVPESVTEGAFGKNKNPTVD